jgi:hypothetical protein
VPLSSDLKEKKNTLDNNDNNNNKGYFLNRNTNIIALQEIIAAVILCAIKFRYQGRKHFTLQIKVCY